MSKFYRKEIPDSAIYMPGGQPLRFDILETADPHLIRELDRCIAKGVGGVIAITAEEYAEEAKKKQLVNGSGSSSNPKRGRLELSALHAKRVAAAVGEGAALEMAGVFAGPQRDKNASPVSGRPMPDPIEVPSPEKFSGKFLKPPPTARASEVNAVK